MFDLLDRIRAKPESTRRKILYATTAAGSFLVMLIWFSTLSVHFTQENEAQVAYENTSPASVFSQTASVFWTDINQAFGNAKEAYGEVSRKIKGEQE